MIRFEVPEVGGEPSSLRRAQAIDHPKEVVVILGTGLLERLMKEDDLRCHDWDLHGRADDDVMEREPDARIQSKDRLITVHLIQ